MTIIFDDVTSFRKIRRLEDYLSEVETELLKKYKKGKVGDNKTLDDLWEKFIATALLVYGENMSPPMLSEDEIIKRLYELKDGDE